ncbi:hypothetical protein [Shewanella sp. GutDb-MelDb]|uniref:hypothetical protein n=1 Tax=Shewanella sp. GutDb-MelDb TaxID=2058316 RepID=UPI0021520D3B|nr:hypothetical protein [Shewanella sp. GutDb-MelDb]
MKLSNRLTVGTEVLPLADYHLVLELSSAGRGVFEVRGEVKLGQVVAFDIGYSNKLQRYFSGYITKATPSNMGMHRIVVRELSSLLAEHCPINIRHATFRQVITQLAKDTGLSFVLPDNAVYLDVKVPNFTSQGTGYQLLASLSGVFGINDCIWYQQPDGQIFVGSYQDSRWPSKPLDIDQGFSKNQFGNSWQLMAMPAMRPGAMVNGHRIKQVELEGDSMTLTWTATRADERSQKRRLTNILPELSGRYHLPCWGKVIALPELPTVDGECASDAFYPRYAVDVQLLDEDGNESTSTALHAVPLPLPGAGNKAGRLEPPAIGAIVEIGFAYGRPDKPFIRCVLPFGWDLPAIKEGESRNQVRDGVYQHVDDKGNFENKTDESLTDIIGKVAELQCKTRKVTANIEQDHRSPKTWLGSEGENVLKLLSELMATVSALASTCASHKHGSSPTPNQAGDFSSQASQANSQKGRLDPITK